MDVSQANAIARVVARPDHERIPVRRSSLWVLCFLLQAMAPMVALHFSGPMFLKDAESRGIVTYKVITTMTSLPRALTGLQMSPSGGNEQCKRFQYCSAGTRTFCVQTCQEKSPNCRAWSTSPSYSSASSLRERLEQVSMPQVMHLASLGCLLASWLPLTVQILFPWVHLVGFLLHAGGLVLSSMSINTERQVHRAVSGIQESGGGLVTGCVRKGVIALGVSHAVCILTAAISLWLARDRVIYHGHAPRGQ